MTVATFETSTSPFDLNRVAVGDCRKLIVDLPDDSVDVVVTSPPYWGQRTSEGTGVEEINFGFWLAGRNCFTHEGSINNPESVSQDMYGEHTGGANTLLASGAVRFIVEATEASIVNALCSRDGNEVVDDF